jgi:lysozyme family protein
MTDFEKALTVILAHEGGYVNHPNDKGGATKQGVTQRVYDTYRMVSGKPTRSVRDIDGGEVAEIYRRQYWNAAGCGVMPYNLALCMFDAAVNHGSVRAVKFLQDAIQVTTDGNIGPQTLSRLSEVLEATGERVLVDRILSVRSDFFNAIVERDPSQRVFLKGWKNRIDRLRKEVS